MRAACAFYDSQKESFQISIPEVPDVPDPSMVEPRRNSSEDRGVLRHQNDSPIAPAGMSSIILLGFKRNVTIHHHHCFDDGAISRRIKDARKASIRVIGDFESSFLQRTAKVIRKRQHMEL